MQDNKMRKGGLSPDRCCTESGVKVAFAATWGGPYSVPKTEAGLADWRKFLDDPRVITICLSANSRH